MWLKKISFNEHQSFYQLLLSLSLPYYLLKTINRLFKRILSRTLIKMNVDLNKIVH